MTNCQFRCHAKTHHVDLVIVASAQHTATRIRLVIGQAHERHEHQKTNTDGTCYEAGRRDGPNDHKGEVHGRGNGRHCDNFNGRSVSPTPLALRLPALPAPDVAERIMHAVVEVVCPELGSNALLEIAADVLHAVGNGLHALLQLLDLLPPDTVTLGSMTRVRERVCVQPSAASWA
jgi:hypothetical protein